MVLDYQEDKIIEHERIYDEKLKKYKEEKKLFAPLKNGAIKKRNS
jgi:hypothetical protein